MNELIYVQRPHENIPYIHLWRGIYGELKMSEEFEDSDEWYFFSELKEIAEQLRSIACSIQEAVLEMTEDP